MIKYFHNEVKDILVGTGRKKYRSKQKIIRYLFLHGEGTCNEIAGNINLSTPSVQTVINDLVHEGVIEEKGRRSSTGGRRPNIYGLRGESFYILCIDIDRFYIRMAILDCSMKVISGIRTYELLLQDDPAYLEKICHHSQNLIESLPVNKEKIIGVGLGMPGVIDADKGINYSYCYNPEETLVDALEKRFNLPVFLDNDANTLTLAEYWLGRARGKKNALVLLLSWGIGLGLILNGNLYRGSSGFAGEFSHIPAKDNGKLCWCNKQGCLETVASATALSALVKEGIRNGSASSLFESFDNSKEYIDPEIVIKAARQGDQFAVKILSEVGFELGKGIAILIQILNPEIIILADSMSKARQYLLTSIQHALNSYCNPYLIKGVRIEISEFGDEAAIMGSAIMVVDRLLSEPG